MMVFIRLVLIATVRPRHGRPVEPLKPILLTFTVIPTAAVVVAIIVVVVEMPVIHNASQSVTGGGRGNGRTQRW